VHAINVHLASVSVLARRPIVQRVVGIVGGDEKRNPRNAM
jgi:hypothetical protein